MFILIFHTIIYIYNYNILIIIITCIIQLEYNILNI